MPSGPSSPIVPPQIVLSRSSTRTFFDKPRSAPRTRATWSPTHGAAKRRDRLLGMMPKCRIAELAHADRGGRAAQIEERHACLVRRLDQAGGEPGRERTGRGRGLAFEMAEQCRRVGPRYKLDHRGSGSVLQQAPVLRNFRQRSRDCGVDLGGRRRQRQIGQQGVRIEHERHGVRSEGVEAGIRVDDLLAPLPEWGDHAFRPRGRVAMRQPECRAPDGRACHCQAAQV